MKLSGLTKFLKSSEWNDVEFKEARTDVPKPAFEAVSAFANTRGGYLAFGVTQNGENYEITGVDKPDKVQSDFLTVLQADMRINHDVVINEQKLRIQGKTVLIFHIKENPRTRKPAYLDGDIRRTFLRRGGINFRAKPQNIERLLRDAATDRWDGQTFDRVPLKDAFHSGSLRWYRERFHQTNPGVDASQSDRDFLYHWGFLVRNGKSFLPTRGAIILFGSPLAIHQIIPRPTLDVQFLGYASEESLSETRWLDRFVCEENIIQAWEQLLAKFLFFMPKPFRDIDPVTLARRDTPANFRVFREAAVNLLIHQDYGDHSRKAVIKLFRDGIQFWNPGDVFGEDTLLWEPGEKEVRNPSITMAFRRITMCEQAGTGLRMIREEWKKLGYPPPRCENDRSRKAFDFFLPGDIGALEASSSNTNPGKTSSETREKTREKILAAIAEDNEITTDELTKRIGITYKGIEWQIRKLKAEGILERIGADNGGHWRIVKNNSDEK